MDKYLTSYIQSLTNKKSKNMIGGMTGGRYGSEAQIIALINTFGTNEEVLGYFFTDITRPNIVSHIHVNPHFRNDDVNTDLGDNFIQHQPKIVEMMCEKGDFNTIPGILAAASAASVCRVEIPNPNPIGGGIPMIPRPIPNLAPGDQPPRPTFGPGVLKALLIEAFCAQTEEDYINIENELTRRRFEEVETIDEIADNLSGDEFLNILQSIKLDNYIPIPRRTLFFNNTFFNYNSTTRNFVRRKLSIILT